ncbi:atrial natriuretic peptide-converting enzyme [Lycorma delicatula]|uniref:atrial natriuretic peptide-converting enzyme n=1 Tax=Lycorma delicatula TaxID=130591 RepID=UPI003F514B87
MGKKSNDVSSSPDSNGNINNNSNGKRKGSWDSKISVSSVSTRPVWLARSGTPSSILSTDSDIRFTRKLGTHYRCVCCIIASFLVFVLVATLSLYAGYTYLSLEPGGERVFRGVFHVIDGDAYTIDMSDPSTELYRSRSREFREGLNLVYRRSYLRSAFIGTEVLALDGEEGGDLVVHFNLHFDPRKTAITEHDLVEILSKTDKPQYLGNRTIDISTIQFKESLPTSALTGTSSTSTVATVQITTTSSPPRSCSLVKLPFCKNANLGYNMTSYPNLLGHKSLQEVSDDVIAFRELVDAECSRIALDFLCRVLQPACQKSLLDESRFEIVLPCRAFCHEFWMGCGSRLPQRFQDKLDCFNFPEYSTVGADCAPKPGCTQSLEAKGLSGYHCDGIPDCPDLSDEMTCSYCEPGHVHCGSGLKCIPSNKQCDGVQDCPNNSDEKACLSLAPTISSIMSVRSSQSGHYYSAGNVVFMEKGLRGKLCIDNLTATIEPELQNSVLETVATSLCHTLTFQNVSSFHKEVDNESNTLHYVQMEDPTAAEISFFPSDCQNKTVFFINCSNIECGLQSARLTQTVDGLGKMAAPGDWPWHVSLFKSGTHVCDATVIDSLWLLTSASCFQGQGKSEWIARLGTVRLTSQSPWQQERHVLGMVKSPVEGSTMVLVKLDRPIVFSDYIRPVCLPKRTLNTNFTNCNTLGWSRNREMLQRIDVSPTEMESCANISITTGNSLCTDTAYSMDDCSEEEVAGSPMVCLQEETQRWTLVGITNWRIACSKSGSQRPRLYDKTESNIDWIRTTVGNIL